MALEYRKVYFVLDQSVSLEGSLHIGTEDGGVLWRGEIGTFPESTHTSTVMSIEEVAALFKQQINEDCQKAILDKFPLIFQLNVSNGLYLDNGMKAWIASMVVESNRCHDLIDTKTVVEDIMGIVPTWPIYLEV